MTLKVWFWHFLSNFHSSSEFCLIFSFGYVNSWPKILFLGPTIFEIPKPEWYHYVYLFLRSDGLFDSNIPTHIITTNEQMITIGSFSNFISIYQKKKSQFQFQFICYYPKYIFQNYQKSTACEGDRPSSIYSWSIGHILENEFFCLGHLGCAGSKGKKVDLSLSAQLFRVVFSTYCGQKKI